MSNLAQEKREMRTALLFCYRLKKTAAEAHRLLVEAYGDNALSKTTCRDWFRRFKTGDLDVEDKERSGQPKKFEDIEMQVLLYENAAQTQKQLAEQLGVSNATISHRLKAMGKIQKKGNWVPYELKRRKIENPSMKLCLHYLRRGEKSLCLVILGGCDLF